MKLAYEDVQQVSQKGMSKGAKIGVGVAVTVAVILVLALTIGHLGRED